jgi:hypothetical protein
MSYLIHLIFRIDSSIPTSEPQLQMPNSEALLETEPKSFDDEWGYLWTDIGGEG